MPAHNPDGSQLIIEAAQRITFSRGVSALRMAELAFELGMSKKTLYAYFPGKDALLVAMMDAHYQHYNDLFQGVLDNPALGFLQRLEATMRLGWEINSVLSVEITQDFRRHAPTLLSTFEQRKATAMQQYFRQLLEEGRREGLLREELALDIVVDILVEAITYRLTRSSLHAKAYSVSDAFTTFYQLLFAGLLKENAQQQYLKTGR